MRAYFGLTQDNLAQFLGIPRATLSLAELDRCGLPLPAMLRMQPLLQQLHDAPPAATPAVATSPPGGPLDPAVQKELLWRQQVCLHEARQLTTQQTKLVQAQRCLAVVPALRAAVAAALTDPDSLESHWLNWFEGQARSTVRRHAEGATALLELRIAVLEFEAQQAGQRATALSPTDHPA